MKYFSKFLVILFILVFACIGTYNTAYAENTLANEASQTGGASSQISTTVKSTSSTENEIFSVTNIINILLVAVGIVIILFAIAILLVIFVKK